MDEANSDTAAIGTQDNVWVMRGLIARRYGTSQCVSMGTMKMRLIAGRR